MAIQESNRISAGKLTDQLVTDLDRNDTNNTTSAATAAEVENNESNEHGSSVTTGQTSSDSTAASEDNTLIIDDADDGGDYEDEDYVDEYDEDEDESETYDWTSDSDDGDNGGGDDNGTGDFFKDNAELLKKVKNILEFVYPNSNISLAELITSAEGYISKYAQNINGGDGSSTSPNLEKIEGGDVTDPAQQSENNDLLIAKGFCAVYGTKLDDFINKVSNKSEYETQPASEPDPQNEKYKYELFQEEKVRVEKLNNAVRIISEGISDPSDSLNDRIIKELVNYCKNNKDAVLDYISYLLKVFYNKWLLPDGSGGRFPYVINTRYYVLSDDTDKKINILVDMDEKETTTDKKMKDKYGSQDIKSSFEKYSTKGTEEDGSSPSETVYSIFYDKDDKKTKYKEFNNFKYTTWSSHYKSCKKRIFSIIEEVKKSFVKPENKYDHQLYLKGDCASTKGKGAIELLQDVSKKLYEDFYLKCNDDSFKVENQEKGKTTFKSLNDEYKKRYPKKEYSFKEFLHDFGLGVDCSGYVSRAIAFVMAKLMVDYEEQKTTLDLDSNGLGLRTNTKHLESDGGSSLLLKCSDKSYEEFFVSGNIQPGDIMRNGSHIRIAFSVNKEQRILIGHQSGSEERWGVREDAISNESGYKTYLKGYTFRRPMVFADEKKLKAYFTNMLKETGKSAV